MKIGNSHDGSVSPQKADRADKASTARKPESTGEIAQPIKVGPGQGPQASAQVAISSAAQIAASGGSDDGSFDAAKVSRISQAISEGKFTINANAIADKLVANAQELLSASSNKH